MEQVKDFFVERIADAVADRLSTMHGRTKRLYSLEEAATYLGLSEDAVRDMVTAGRLKAIRMTRRLQFDVQDLDLAIDEEKAKY